MGDADTAVIRVYHSVALINGADTEANGSSVDLSLFKTIKIDSTQTSKDVVNVLAAKLKIQDTSRFCLYSLDSHINSIKRKLEAEEIPMELVSQDITKKLKLAILKNEEAATMQGAEREAIQFYSLAGQTVQGPFPRPKEHYLPHPNDVLRHRKLLNAEIVPFMNLTMIVDGGRERLYSMRTIVEQRCPSLLLAVSFIKKKKEKKGDLMGPITIEYKEGTIVNAFTLSQILEWCYTSTLDFESLNLPDVMVILKAAQALDIPHLRWICDQYIRSELTVATSFIIIKQAVELEMEDMKTLATDFAHNKWGQFAANKEGMAIIGIELFQELTISMTQRNAAGGSRASVMTERSVKDTLLSDFETVYRDGRFVDGEFLVPPAKDGEEPTVFKFHKAILAAYCKPFYNMICMSTKVKQFTLEGLNKEAVRDLLEFIYFNKQSLDPVGSCQIIEHAMNQYSLHDIRDTASDSISRGITRDNAIPILRLTYLPQCKHRTMVNLRENALDFICENWKEVDIPSLREIEHSHFDHHLMADVLDAYFFHENPAARDVYSPSTTRKDRRNHSITHASNSSLKKEVTRTATMT